MGHRAYKQKELAQRRLRMGYGEGFNHDQARELGRIFNAVERSETIIRIADSDRRLRFTRNDAKNPNGGTSSVSSA